MRADRRRDVDAQRLAVGTRELGHDRSYTSSVRVGRESPVREPSGRAAPIRTAGRAAASCLRKYARSVAADRRRESAWEPERTEDAVLCSTTELRPSWATGFEPATTSRVTKEPRLRSRPNRCQGARQLQRHRELRGQGSNLELLVQSQVWFRSTTSHWVWTERIELPTSGFRSRRASVALRPGGTRTDGGSRTRTDGGLSAVPLPVGLRQRGACRGPRGSRTRNLLLAGELRFRLRHRPWWRRAGIEPAGRAYETSLISRSPASMVVTGRTRTGFLRDHDPASRPLQTSATVDEEGFEPPASCL